MRVKKLKLRKRGLLAAILLVCVFSFLSINISPVYGALPSTVGTSTNSWGGGNDSYSHNIFKEHDLFWFFYTDGTNLGYKTSSDGETWGSFTSLIACGGGFQFGVMVDEGYVEIIVGSQTAGVGMNYRKGNPNADSTITWSDAWQLILDEAAYSYLDPMINLDTSNRPWVGYAKWEDATSIVTPWVITSTLSNGTWNTKTGFPYQLDTNDDGGNPGWYVPIGNLTSDKMYIFKHGYTQAIKSIRGIIYDAGWGSWHNITTVSVHMGANIAVVSTSNGDLYLQSDSTDWNYGILIHHYDASANSWSYMEKVFVCGGGPKLIYDPQYQTLFTIVTGRDAEFAPGIQYGRDGGVYYRRYNILQAAWGPDVEWFIDTEITEIDRTSDSGYVYQNTISFGYTAKASSPYDVRFNYITVTAFVSTFTFRGLNSEYNGTLLTSGVNVTVYVDGYDPWTFEVNGTETRGFYNVPRYAHFDLPNNPDREYWFSPTETSGTIWIFTDTSLTEYIIQFLDLDGVLDDYSFVEARLNVNGTVYTVERRKADIEKKVMFSLKEGRKYTIYVEDGVSYEFGDLLMTSTTTITLTLTGLEFPQTVILAYRYVRLYAERHNNSTSISLLYEDLDANTDNVVCKIKYANGTVAYTTTQYVNSFNVTWISAWYNTTYYVTMDSTHNDYGEINYRATMYRGGFNQNPWSLDWLGTIPGGMVTSSLIPIFLVFAVAGIFSKVNAYTGAFMACMVAILFAWWGWLEIPAAMLVTALFFALIMGLAHKKKGSLG